VLNLKVNFTPEGENKGIIPCSLVIDRKKETIERLAGLPLYYFPRNLFTPGRKDPRDDVPVLGLEKNWETGWYVVPLYWDVPVTFVSALISGASYVSVQGTVNMTLSVIDCWDRFNEVNRGVMSRRLR
jgi:hypothetical protein